MTKKLVSSAYWESLKVSFWFGMGYPTILSFSSMFRLTTSLLIMYKRRDKGQPCRTPLDSWKGLDK